MALVLRRNPIIVPSVALPIVVEDKEILTPVPKTGISFDTLYTFAKEIQNLCEDYVVPCADEKTVRWIGESGKLRYSASSGDTRESAMSRHAFSQFCTRIGMHVKYANKCLAAGFNDLAADNINTWVQEYQKSLFIREYNDKIRGVLTERYMTLDLPDVLTVIADVIDSKQYATKDYYLSPERFHARIVQRRMMKIEGEDLFAGLQVDTSDVGRSVLLVRFFIYKLVCTNGMISPQSSGVLFEQRHVGINVDGFRSDFRKSMERIPTLVNNMTEMIQAARKDKLKIKSLSKDEMEDFVLRFRAKTELSEEGVSKVLRVMQDKYTPTRWGLVNALTEVAQDYTLERRLVLEQAAGRILLAA